MPDRRRLGAAALIVALLVHAVIAVNAWRGGARPASDFDRYYQIAAGSGRPYLDYEVEHPIGTLALFKALAIGNGGRDAFGPRIVLVNVAADMAIVGALTWGWDVEAAAAFAIVVLPAVDLLFNRIDLWSMASASIGVALWQRNRRAASAMALSAGAAFKLWPLIFAVLLAAPPSRTGPARRINRRPLVVFIASGVAIAGIWWFVAGSRGLYQVLTFRSAGGWQIESTVGAWKHLLGGQSLRLESGSWRIGSTSGGISILLLAVSAPLAMWSVWRGGLTRRVGTGWLAGVATLLVLSPLLSAQFVGWLAPGAAVAWSEGDRRHAALATAAIVLTAIFWSTYDGVLEGNTTILAIVVARNVGLIVLAVSGAKRLMP